MALERVPVFLSGCVHSMLLLETGVVFLIYWSAQAYAGATVSIFFRLRGPPPSDPPLEPNVQIYVYVLFNLNL